MSEPTEANVEQTKATPPTQTQKIAKTEVTEEDGRWYARIEYVLEDGEKTEEERDFDEFSQASSWVAGTEVEVEQQNPSNPLQDQGSEDNAEDQEAK